jgi:hypothetical protein
VVVSEEAVAEEVMAMEEVVAVDQAGVVAEVAEEGDVMVVVVVVEVAEKGLEEAAGPEAECLETPAVREAEGCQTAWLAADLQMTLVRSLVSQS